MNVSKFERFFRVAGGLDMDKTDLKRCSDFVHRKAYDRPLMSQPAARFNLRDVIEFWDLPITKGLQESIHGFTKLDEQIELEPILEGRTQLPPLDLEYGEETRLRLPSVYGGPSVALTRASKSLICISKIPRRNTGRPLSGCSICCCESDISKSEGHRLKGDFSDGSKSHTQECADCDRECLRGSSTRAARCSRLARDNPSRNGVARRRD